MIQSLCPRRLLLTLREISRQQTLIFIRELFAWATLYGNYCSVMLIGHISCSFRALLVCLCQKETVLVHQRCVWCVYVHVCFWQVRIMIRSDVRGRVKFTVKGKVKGHVVNMKFLQVYWY